MSKLGEVEWVRIGDYQHQRGARQVPIDPDALWERAGGGPVRGHNMRWTLIECAHPITTATKQELMAESGT